MNKPTSKRINDQKKVTRGLKGLIIALFAAIGILKISIGGVVNVPIALLFGDIFIGFFTLLIMFAFYLMLFPLPKTRARNVYVFLSLIGLLTVSAVLYASILRDFGQDNSLFRDNLNAMIVLARENFKFTAAKDNYWYSFAGIFGEGIVVLLAPTGKGFIITFIIITTLLLLTVIFWPFILWVIAHIKEYLRDLKKRRKVLHAAGILHNETPKEAPTQVTLEDVISKEDIVPDNPLLQKVATKKVETPVTESTPKNVPISTPKEDQFVLPTLDIEEKIEAVQTSPLHDEPMQKVADDNFENLQRALDTSGSIEAVAMPQAAEVVTEKAAKEEVVPVTTPEPEVAPTPVAFSDEHEPSNVKIRSSYANFRLPSIDLLEGPVESGKDEANRLIAAEFEHKINGFFSDFGIGAHVTQWTIGSTFTRFEIQLDPRQSLKAITPHMNDISLRLNGASVRFEPIIPGKATSGLEVGNTHRTIVNFKECMEDIIKKRGNEKFMIPLGKDVAGNVISASFNDFPHLLVAGSTGSGKSVFIHTVLTALIMRHTPDELRLLLIDPKRVELAQYANIPHLITPIIKEPSESKVALDRLIDEMERRYKLFEAAGVSKVSDYNDIAADAGHEKLSIIVAIVDEFADLFESEKEVSTLVLRLVQKSRAAGIHLLIATQRPSVQVITGNIKANIPSRVAFMTASVTDSMTILGQGGAEALLGLGDMLVDSLAVTNRGFLRIQSPFIPIKEVLRITNYLRTNYMTSFYEEFLDLKEKVTFYGGLPESDDLYDAVLEFVSEQDTISINRIQNYFQVGFQRARTLYEMLMANGVIEAPDEANSSRGAIVVRNHGR